MTRKWAERKRALSGDIRVPGLQNQGGLLWEVSNIDCYELCRRGKIFQVQCSGQMFRIDGDNISIS